MKTIILTYPGFQSLPKGIKQMLLASENFYYGETGRAADKSTAYKPVALPFVTIPLAPDFRQPDHNLAAA